MARKAFRVKVELGIQAVTCPGVWLCPKGRVSLRFRMFGVSGQTNELDPVFPLLFHENFTFRKTFTKVRYLTDLQMLLRGHFLTAELFQWPENGNIGNILASFETSLEELLYPSPCGRGLIAGVDVDLLMEPTCCFPGILAPKIEVNTKTTIEEVYNSSICPEADPFLIKHKMLSSKTGVCVVKKRRTRTVCHTRSKKRVNKPRCRRARRMQTFGQQENVCAPGRCFCVGRVVRSLSARPTARNRRCGSPCCQMPPRAERSVSPLPRSVSTSPQHSRRPIFYNVNTIPKTEYAPPGRRCSCPLDHLEGSCPVCNKYEKAFQMCDTCHYPITRSSAFPKGCVCKRMDTMPITRPNLVRERFTPTTSAYRPNPSTSAYRPNQPTSTYRPNESTTAYRPNEGTSAYRPNEGTSSYRPNEPTPTYRLPNAPLANDREANTSNPLPTCHANLTVRHGKSGKQQVYELNGSGNPNQGSVERRPIAESGGAERRLSRDSEADRSRSGQQQQLSSSSRERPLPMTNVYSFLSGIPQRSSYQPPLGMSSKPSYRDVFYQNLEKFYKKLYDRAKCPC